jgi:EmrB/QacA subfamily drug resistance transporter
MARERATLALLCTMALMIVLDGTVVSVAVPTIQRDLGFSPTGIAWVANAYLVAFAGLLLLAGRLGDLIGAARVFTLGVAVFTLASLLCGLAPNAGLLIAGRFVQGAGGALASAVILGMIVRGHPGRAAQARAMGIYSFTQAAGSTIGFVVGGLLTDVTGWPSIFFINVPIGIAVLVVARRVLPREAGQGLRAGLDMSGASLVTAGLSLGVYAIVDTNLWSAAGAVLLIAGFLLRESRARFPLIDLHVLGRPWLLRANAAVILIFAAGFGFQFLTALYVQRILGFDALHTGLAFLPTPLVIGPVSLLVAPRLTARFGPRPVLLGGLALTAAGLAVLSHAPADPSYPATILPALLIIGAGMGVAIPAIIMLSMAGAEPADTGLVSGFTNTAQQAGAALGLATLAAVAAARTGPDPSIEALRDGYSLAFLVAAAFLLGALLVAALLLRDPHNAPAAADARTSRWN